MSNKFNSCLVVTFASGERTERLSNFCFEKLGFENRITISGADGFHDKFLSFAKIATESKYDYFIRNDADRLVFSGIIDLLEMVMADDSLSWATGTYFDYVMNRFRCGTPSVHRKDCLAYLNDNQHLMKDVQKPEASFANSIKDKFKLSDVDIFTNLHEYEQYPSKICNAFLNRLARNHYPRLYNDSYLASLPEHYGAAISEAFNIFSKEGNKNSMKFRDFSHLDGGFIPIDDSDLDSFYKRYHELYNSLSQGQ